MLGNGSRPGAFLQLSRWLVILGQANQAEHQQPKQTKAEPVEDRPPWIRSLLIHTAIVSHFPIIVQ
jgi:hypothetical protein